MEAESEIATFSPSHEERVALLVDCGENQHRRSVVAVVDFREHGPRPRELKVPLFA
jgi:hypothetical protein